MRQEPILLQNQTPRTEDFPKYLRVTSVFSCSYHMVSIILAVLWHLLCLLLIIFCFQMPKKPEIPFHSEIEVSFQEDMQPVPDDVPALSDSNTESTEVSPPEPEQFAENLPDSDIFSQIPIQKPIEKPKLTTGKQQTILNHSSSQTEKQKKTEHNLSNKSLQTQGRATSDQQNKNVQHTTTKVLSSSQRCTAPVGQYPLASRKRHEQGQVIVRFQLLPNGIMTQVSVEQSSGFVALDNAAVQAVQNMKCQPALDQPILKTKTPVNFRLH